MWIELRGAMPLVKRFRPFRACAMLFHEFPRALPRAEIFRPFRACVVFIASFPGRCPGLRSSAPSGLVLSLSRVSQGVAPGCGLPPLQGLCCLYREFPRALPRAEVFRPFRACVVFIASFPGRCPGLRSFAPSGLVLRCSASRRVTTRIISMGVAHRSGISPLQGVTYIPTHTP
jgi:hypothetical protein